MVINGAGFTCVSLTVLRADFCVKHGNNFLRWLDPICSSYARGIEDFSVLEGRQRVGRIRLAEERLPPAWIWQVQIYLPAGSADDRAAAMTQFKEAWTALKARTPPEQMAAAFAAMNIRGDE
jgi:hypothetical protein